MRVDARMIGLRKVAFLVAVGLVLLLPLASCDQDDATTCPEDLGIGVVEGIVRAGGVGVDAWIQARTRKNSFSFPPEYYVRADQDGRYRFELPIGDYFLSVSPPGRLSSDLILHTDTVRVGRSPTRADFEGGSATVRLLMPPALEGARFHGRLVGEGRSVRAMDLLMVREGALEAVFPLVAPGVHLAKLEWRQHGFWYPGRYDPAEAESIRVGIDRHTVVERTVDRYASMAGSFLRMWDRAIVGSQYVEAYDADSMRVGQCLEDEDGSFFLNVFDPRPVRVLATDGDLRLWLGGDSFETATVFELKHGDAVTGVEIHDNGILCLLRGPGYLSHHDARVRLIDEHGREVRPRLYSSNPLLLHLLRPGRYLLQVYHECDYSEESWAPQWYDGVESIHEATPIEILDEGELISLTMELVGGATVSGSMLPWVGGWKMIYVLGERGEIVCSAQADRYTGAFRFTGFADGDYRLRTYVGNGRTWWYDGTEDPDSARVVTISDHADVAGLEWFLPE